jgi:hypothetical protein
MLELDGAIYQREQRVVSAHSDIGSRMDAGSALPDDYRACADQFVVVTFYAKPFGIAISTIASAAAALLVCHDRFSGFWTRVLVQ